MLTGFGLTGTALSDELGERVPSTTRLLRLVKERRDLRRRSRWQQPRFRGCQRAGCCPRIQSAELSSTVHVLQSRPDTVSSGVIDPRRPAALTVESGDVVSCPNTWTQRGNQARFGMSFSDREPLRKQFPTGPYSNLGPVVVSGTEPGDRLECRMLRTRPIDWGWNSFPLGVGALPSDFDEPYVHYFRFSEDRSSADFVHGIRIPLRPSMGVYAV